MVVKPLVVKEEKGEQCISQLVLQMFLVVISIGVEDDDDQLKSKKN